MQKIKLFLESEKGKDILIILIVILVGLASFELGRLSKSDGSSGINIKYPNGEQANVISAKETDVSNNLVKVDSSSSVSNSNSSKNFFASKRGHKYYSLGCTAGKTIKEENRIYFKTAEEAIAKGYTLSSSCN